MPKKRPKLTPPGFRRLINKELELVNSRPTTAEDQQDQLKAFYRISKVVNRHFPGRQKYGDNQFNKFAEEAGHSYAWLYEIRYFAQRYTAEELKELCSYDPPLCWGHVRLLFPVHDKRRRRKLQRLTSENGWGTERLRHEIRSRMGPGKHRGRGVAGLENAEECLVKLNRLSRKWTQVAEAAIEEDGPLANAEIGGGCEKLLEGAQDAVERLKSVSGKLQRQLKKLASEA